MVSIERAGPAADGKYYTMSKKDMSHMLAPLDGLFDQALEGGVVGTTGIGDGGNEVGMGNVAAEVREHINNGQTIACITPVENLITSSVSNWCGATALSWLADPGGCWSVS